jgi:hypothetical protein
MNLIKNIGETFCIYVCVIIDIQTDYLNFLILKITTY